MRRWAWMVPVVGLAVAIGWPLTRYVERRANEATAAGALEAVAAAQARVAAAHGAFAATLESLTRACPGVASPVLDRQVVDALATAGYELTIRAAAGAAPRGEDCHGRPAVSDYYAGVQPASASVPAWRAFAVTGTGRVFVFFDGVAPRERDMGPDGLAMPLEQVASFTIP